MSSGVLCPFTGDEGRMLVQLLTLVIVGLKDLLISVTCNSSTLFATCDVEISGCITSIFICPVAAADVCLVW